MPNVMATLPNIGGAHCSTPQSFTDACKGVLSDVNRYKEVTNFLILSAGSCIVTVM